jgi:hypothetical protein
VKCVKQNEGNQNVAPTPQTPQPQVQINQQQFEQQQQLNYQQKIQYQQQLQPQQYIDQHGQLYVLGINGEPIYLQSNNVPQQPKMPQNLYPNFEQQ